ncbi:MAG: DUF4823 domain-containing protein [Ruminobacter sp.]|nr:DUF4823 domain-containing protein [Ruminobacter sp.]
MRNKHHVLKTVLLSLLVCGSMAACSTKFKNLHSEMDPSLAGIDMQNARVIINHAKAGTAPSYGKVYDLSGIYFSNCMKDIATHYNPSVKLAKNVSSELNMITELREKKDVDYLIFGNINNWEDHATEWNGIPDRINIDIKLYDVASGNVLAEEHFMSSSKWATFGGDHPQDLLAKPIIDIFKKWFRSDKVLNPKIFPCENRNLQYNYSNRPQQ